MPELFTETGIDVEVLKEHLGDDYYNDPDTKQEPTKIFDNIKDEKTFTKNYVNAQRTISKGEAAFDERIKGMVKLPTDESTPEEVTAYHEAIGVPKTSDGYKLNIPEGDDKESFEGIAAVIKEEALAAGASPALLTRLWDKVTTVIQGQVKALEDKGLALIKADDEAQKAEHKEKYDTFIKTTDAALAKFKVGEDVKKLLETYGIGNHPSIRKLLAEVAPLVLGGKTILGDGETGEKEGGFPAYEYDENGKPISS